MQTIDQWPEPLDQFGIAVSKFIKSSSLLFKYSKDSVGRVAMVEHGGAWMVDEIMPGLLRVLGQGSLEKSFKVRGRRRFPSGWGHRDNGRVLSLIGRQRVEWREGNLFARYDHGY